MPASKLFIFEFFFFFFWYETLGFFGGVAGGVAGITNTPGE